ncbi:MAG: putative Cell division control protein 42 [Streblomastix strix]|uniref:Putative Cell division control protein 42 n=1 Tax=Streblomastix strix TaxID=222440 RepID=A0A5J4V5P5_9EUKA|nr:MAG: putative Cell division control protein 42 [Streblomastix strix]
MRLLSSAWTVAIIPQNIPIESMDLDAAVVITVYDEGRVPMQCQTCSDFLVAFSRHFCIRRIEKCLVSALKKILSNPQRILLTSTKFFSRMAGVTDIKLVVVGDGAVGKTCMLMSFTQNKFPEEYVATVFDNCESLIVVDGKTIHLQIWDTAGQEEYDRLRGLSYPDTDAFIICYAVNDPVSLDNVEKKWFPEIKQYIARTPVILVGTKSDFRTTPGPGMKLVTERQAETLVSKLKLSKHVECSAKTQLNLTRVFETVAREYMTIKNELAKPPQGCSCSIL